MLGLWPLRLLALFSLLHVGAGGLPGFSKKGETLDIANKILSNKVDSEDLVSNIEGAKQLLSEGVTDYETRRILEKFTTLKSSYLGSCTQADIDQVHDAYNLISHNSKSSNLSKKIEVSGRLNRLIAESTLRLVQDCFHDIQKEFSELPPKSGLMRYHEHRILVRLISNAHLDGTNTEIDVVKRLLRAVKKADFAKLANLSWSNVRSKWKNYFSQITKSARVPLREFDPSTGQSKVTSSQMSKLYNTFVTEKCQALRKGNAGDLLSRAADLVSWSNLSMINYDAYRYQVDVFYMTVVYMMCKHIEMPPSDEFIERLAKVFQDSKAKKIMKSAISLTTS